MLLHAGPGRQRVRGHGHRRDRLRPVRDAGPVLRRRPGAHLGARPRLLPLRAEPPPAARRAHRQALPAGRPHQGEAGARRRRVAQDRPGAGGQVMSGAERIVFGFHSVLARLRADPKSVLEVFLDETRKDARAKDFAVQVERAGARLMRVPASRLEGMAGEGRHQGVVARVTAQAQKQTLEELLESLKVPPLLLVLDGITDPHNLGACLRVANAAGAHAVIAPKDHAAGINATVSKVASGAAEVTPYFMVTNLVRTLNDLKDRNIWLVGTDSSASESIYSVKELPSSIAWVMGAEGAGMRRLTRETCDLLVRIPMRGQVESLNASVAAGVCLFESVRRSAILRK